MLKRHIEEGWDHCPTPSNRPHSERRRRPEVSRRTRRRRLPPRSELRSIVESTRTPSRISGTPTNGTKKAPFKSGGEVGSALALSASIISKSRSLCLSYFYFSGARLGKKCRRGASQSNKNELPKVVSSARRACWLVSDFLWKPERRELTEITEQARDGMANGPEFFSEDRSVSFS